MIEYDFSVDEDRVSIFATLQPQTDIFVTFRVDTSLWTTKVSRSSGCGISPKQKQSEKLWDVS